MARLSPPTPGHASLRAAGHGRAAALALLALLAAASPPRRPLAAATETAAMSEDADTAERAPAAPPARRAGLLKTVWRIVRIPLFVYVGLLILLFCFQGCLVYRPTREIEATPAAVGLVYESLPLKTDDGLEIAAWYVPAPASGRDARGVVLFCHGNGGNISHRLHTLALLNRLGLATLIFDYRGYGRSQGRPSEKGTYRDADAAWRYLVEERNVPPERIVAHGRSLGGAVAAYLAQKHNPRLLILDSSFTSVPDLGQEIYWFVPVRLLARIKYDARRRLADVRCPVLIVHSRDDEIVPVRHGRRLLDAANEPKEFVELTGGHNEASAADEYESALAAFFDKHLPPGQ